MNPEHELSVLATMAGELNDYLLSDVLFWQMQARSNVPKLSLGMLLLTRARLQALRGQLGPSQQAQFDEAARQVETVLSQWQVAAENKAEQELRSRLNLWQRFWDECRDEPRVCADNYPHEVTQRAIAGLLLREFPRLQNSPEAQPLRALDTTIRARLQGQQFVWDPAFQTAFPPGEFWYLYGLPRR